MGLIKNHPEKGPMLRPFSGIDAVMGNFNYGVAYVDTHEYSEKTYQFKALEDGFTSGHGYIVICKDKLKAFFQELKNDPSWTVYQFQDLNKIFIAESEHIRVIVNTTNRWLSLFAKAQTIAEQFVNKYEQFFDVSERKSIHIDQYYSGENGATHKRISLDQNELSNIIPELYPDIDIAALHREFRLARETVLILYGAPGVGKTSFLKYMAKSGDYNEIAYVKDTKVMASSSFWSNIGSEDYDLIVFDDLDHLLVPRDESESEFMSQLLSYSDGIFKQSSKIVITTNQPVKRIDPALIRPGRCYDFIDLKPLNGDEARNIWINILKAPESYFDILFGSMQVVSQAALMSEHNRLTKGISERTYVRRGINRYSLDRKLSSMGIVVHTKQTAGI